MRRKSMPTLELVLHPVRLRILNAMSGGRTATTSELCARMPDQSQATVYRHVALLAKGGLLEVEEEQQVRGAVERRYRVLRDRSMIGPEAAAAMSLEEHRLGFTAAMAALLGEFNTYLDRGGAQPFADSVSYRQATLWLEEKELAALVRTMQKAVMTLVKNKARPGRRPYRTSLILFPE
jgi:DNA-binding transcriptional ArsR family regulator